MWDALLKLTTLYHSKENRRRRRKERNAGFTVNNIPVAGAVFQSNPGTNGSGGYGHVGVVESVNSNGTVTVSEMNWNGGFNVKSYRTITNPGSYNYIH